MRCQMTRVTSLSCSSGWRRSRSARLSSGRCARRSGSGGPASGSSPAPLRAHAHAPRNTERRYSGRTITCSYSRTPSARSRLTSTPQQLSLRRTCQPKQRACSPQSPGSSPQEVDPPSTTLSPTSRKTSVSSIRKGRKTLRCTSKQSTITRGTSKRCRHGCQKSRRVSPP